MAKVLIVGSGAREHAIAVAFQRDTAVEEVFVSPGNDGIAQFFSCFKYEAKDKNEPFVEIVNFVKEKKIDYVFVGNEQALADGIADYLEAHGIDVIGPSQKAAQIESSKVFSKNLMKKYGVPTADYAVCEDYVAALRHIAGQSFPLVLKADGLAAGKGVIIAQDKQEAIAALDLIFLDKKFGNAGNQVIIESFLSGEEASIFAFSDGEHFVSTVFSQDHKALYDNDEGPNTGGMGAFAPVDKFFMLKDKVDKVIFEPIFQGLKNEGMPFKGVLYAGLMIDGEDINVVEFNCRLGDPEAEVILPIMTNSLAELCQAIIEKSIDQCELKFSGQYAVGVISASKGYPEAFERGKPIFIHKGIETLTGQIYFAGVKQQGENLFTNGGRVLCATALGSSLQEAIDKAYSMTECVQFSNQYYRKDIGQKGLKV